ncbi:MAG: F0F1 ATP synthase subunit A [Thermoanaerobaculia bacterium]
MGIAENPLEHVVQHTLAARPANWGFLTPNGLVTLLSDQIVMMLVAAALLVLFVPAWVRRRRGADEVGRHVPARGGNMLEAVCQYLRKNIAEPMLGEHTDRFIPYIWTVFFFILTINLLGLLPIAPLAGLFGLHLGGTATANIWVTATLAILTMLMMVINGIRFGGKHYLAHFNPGPWWLAPLLVPVEIIGLVSKIFALAVRLFANMVAGHIMLAVLLGFILSAGAASAAMGFGIAVPVVIGSVAITFLEILVAFLHAFIFTVLTTIFIGQSVLFHHDEAEAH